VDDSISKQVLEVVQPVAIEAAVLAHEEQSRMHDGVLTVLRRDLEAARYAAQRAQRQFDAADPENRLVTGELELRWNQALDRVRQLELRIEAQTSNPPVSCLHQHNSPISRNSSSVSGMIRKQMPH
jgi:hypothetical protein